MNILEKLRDDINEIDSELLGLLAKRRRISTLVGENKIKLHKPIRDPAREIDLLKRLIGHGQSLGLDRHYINHLFQVIIEDSVLNQQALLQATLNGNSQITTARVAYLGSQGSYSHLACMKYFSRRASNIVELNCSNFPEIIRKVENSEADYALLPIENSSSGSINEVYDLLQHTSLSIIGELTQPVNHCLMAISEVDLNQIEVIYTHPQPQAQCSIVIDKLFPHVKVIHCDSTSAACAKVKELNSPSVAAIGSAEGGKTYGLVTIKEELANQKDNFSRFIVVNRKPVDVADLVPAKTTIIMNTEQHAGSLVDALLILKKHNINMTKLESRPIYGNPWEEMFYLDLEGNTQLPDMAQALKELEIITKSLKVLGCYPSDDIKHVILPTNE